MKVLAILVVLYFICTDGRSIAPNGKLRARLEIQNILSRQERDVNSNDRSERLYGYMRQILPLLQMYAGSQIDIRHFENYDYTINVSSVFYVKPVQLSHVQRVVRAANWLGLHVRAVGQFMSRSPLYVDEGDVMLDTTELQRHDGPRMQLNQPTAERKFMTVTTMSGVYAYDLNAFLVRHHVTMMSQPITFNNTIGGVVATASHGSSWDGAAVSGYVVGVRLVNSRGQLVTFTLERNEDIMKAIQCNLGVFGILYDITLKVFPTKVVRVENTFITINDVFYNATALKDIVTTKFLTETTWYPFSGVTDAQAEEYQKSGTIPDAWSTKDDTVWLRTIEVVDEVDESMIQGPVYLPTEGALTGGNATGLLRGREALAVPRALPAVSYHYLLDAFAVFKHGAHGPETSSSFMMNVDAEFDRPTRATQFILQEAENQMRTNGTTPTNALFTRYVLNADCYMCPANTAFNIPGDTGRSFVTEMLATPFQEGLVDTGSKFIEAFKDESIRPHWPKRYDNIPGIINHIQRVYGNNIREFMDARAKANVDPCDMFMNSYLIQLLGHSERFC